MTSLKKFHLFSALPTELRLQIWELAIPPSRIIPIRKLEIQSSGARRRSRHSVCWHSNAAFWGAVSHFPPPSILLVNHESFLIASKYYELAFDYETEFEHTFVKCKPTWIDFQRDVVYINSKAFAQNNFNKQCWMEKWEGKGFVSYRNKIINLAMHATDFLGWDRRHNRNNTDNPQNTWKVLFPFENITKFYIIVDHVVRSEPVKDFEGWSEELVLVNIPGAESVDISRTLGLSNAKPYTPAHGSVWNWDDVPSLDDTDYYLDLEEFEIYSENWYERHEQTARKTPDICQRVMCDQRLYQDLLQKVEQYAPAPSGDVED